MSVANVYDDRNPKPTPSDAAFSPIPAAAAGGGDSASPPFRLFRAPAVIWPPEGPDPPSPVQLAVKQGTESCVFKAGISAVAGGGMGLLFGLFFGGYTNAVDKAVDMQGSTAVKLRVGMREAWTAMASYAKNFARFGVIFSAAECTLDKVRARHDMPNVVGAGCVTGAAMAAAPSEVLPARARAITMAGGCASVGLFSAAIEYYMHLD